MFSFGRDKKSASYVDLDAKQLAEQIGQLALIDVREPEELQGELGHIAGVKNVPLKEVLAGKLLSEISVTTPVVLICRSGGRSARAAAALGARGYREVYNLAGGMIGWNRAGQPVERR